MTKFEQLYQYCQDLPCPPYIERNAIRKKAVEISGNEVVVWRMSLDVEACRGFFVCATNADSPFTKQAGGRSVIILARELNYCWERFVQVKELMHLFDGEISKTSSAEQFTGLLNDIVAPVPAGTTNPQLISEANAIWMALACLCPEKTRLQFVNDVQRGHIDHYGIALQLRIPQKYVPHLLHPSFLEIVARCTRK